MLAGIVLGGCQMPLNRAGIELMSTPSAKVYIDGKEAGMTPYENKNLRAGEVEVKLVGNDGVKWEKKVKLTTNASTVVDWKLSQENDSGYIINVEKTGDKDKSGIIVNTFPTEAAVLIDGTVVGYGPVRADDIGIGDKQITISFPGYQTQTIFMKAWAGLRLVIEVKLAKSEYQQATPTPMPTMVAPSINQKRAKILDTETGFLRVRGQPNSQSQEVGRVEPGNTVEVLEEDKGWYKIILGGAEGWISAKYVELIEE